MVEIISLGDMIENILCYFVVENWRQYQLSQVNLGRMDGYFYFVTLVEN